MFAQMFTLRELAVASLSDLTDRRSGRVGGNKLEQACSDCCCGSGCGCNGVFAPFRMDIDVIFARSLDPPQTARIRTAGCRRAALISFR